MLSRDSIHVALPCLVAAAAILVDCSGGGARVIARPPEVSPIAVAGDSPEELSRNLAAARAAGKTVRIVTVTSALGADLYSPYSQILRSRTALLVRAYGRIHVYRLAGTTVAFPQETPVAIAALPEVDTPTIDAAMTRGSPLGVSAERRRSMCLHCDFVLVRSAGSAKSSTLWADAKDPWQKTPDYAYWAPGSDTATKRGTSSFVECDIYSGGCCPNYQPAYVVCMGYYPGGWGSGGGGGGYSCGATPCYYYFARIPTARWDLTAEQACRQQGGRFADIWQDTPTNSFYCQHVTETKPLTILSGYVNTGCLFGITLPVYHPLASPIIVNVTGPSLTPSGTTYDTGVRVDMLRCYWRGDN